MPKAFSRETIRKFEDASAGIPLRQLVRPFEAAGIRMGDDPGGSEGSRRTQFRRYVAGVDQRDAQQLDRLGDALGALVGEVATSKVEFLVNAAETDGFVFTDGVFRRAPSTGVSFAVTRLEDVASIGERSKRLYLLTEKNPKDAIGGAKELVDSLCRTILGLRGKPLPKKTSLGTLAKVTLDALGPVPDEARHADTSGEFVRTYLQAVVVLIDDLPSTKRSSTIEARVAVGAALTFAGFVADTYLERFASSKEPPSA